MNKAEEIIPGLTRIPLAIPKSGFESFISVWLVRDEKRGKTLLFESGPAVSVNNLCEDLKRLGVTKIDYLIYTHVHLDHSGGAGQFHDLYPDTKIVAPLKGRKHLISPFELMKGSKLALGELCNVYGDPKPLPESALVSEDFSLDGLQIIHTPGHSSHHNSYVYDLNGSKILFVGEAAGCCFELSNACMFMRPATPQKFYYESAIKSIDTLLSLHGISLICYPHASCSRNWKELVKDARTQMEFWKEILEKLPDGFSVADGVAAVKSKDPVMGLLQYLPESDRKREEFFIGQSVKGYIGYFERMKECRAGTA